MNQTGVITQTVDLRELAREWIAETIRKHLAPELGGSERIQRSLLVSKRRRTSRVGPSRWRWSLPFNFVTIKTMRQASPMQATTRPRAVL